jgi:putative DNA primase/helicase
LRWYDHVPDHANYDQVHEGQLRQEQGLNPPQIVLEQVSAYKTEMDSIAQFVEQECSLEPETKYPASKLYEAYRHFCQAIGRKR